ncbi:MAG: nucleotidyltransferase domain-containing protein [Candidatus Odinarchaeia archaeon]
MVGVCMLYLYEAYILSDIKKIIKDNKDKINLALLYGSITKGNHKPDSDIDLVVVADEKEINNLRDKFAIIYLKYSVPISVIFYTPAQFNFIKTHPFIRRILKEGRILWEKKKTG